jgi:serine/threonine protein kinase
MDRYRRIPIACCLVTFVLEGLEWIHRNHIVHRDVKENDRYLNSQTIDELLLAGSKNVRIGFLNNSTD